MKFTCALLWAAAAAFGQDANVSGKWSGVFRNGPLFVTLQQEGNKLSGRGGPTEMEQPLDFTGGSVEGDHVVFQAATMRFDLRLAGDTLRGELTMGGEVSKFYLKRVQADSVRVSFEVASVKRVPPRQPGESFRSSMKLDPGRLTGVNVSLKKLVMNSYSLRDYQLTGPEWMDAELFDIVATMPRETNGDEVIRMLKALLADRFHLEIHKEVKEIPVYGLVVGKNGLKLKEVEFGPSGLDTRPGKIVGRKVAMSNVANSLSRQLDRPVVDMTGLKGFYDFDLEWALDEGAAMAKPGESGALPDSSSGPPLMVALQQQLGLKLEMRKAPVEIMVIDKVDRTPTEN